MKKIFFIFLVSIFIGGCSQQIKKDLGGGYFEYQNKIYFNTTGNELLGVDNKSFSLVYEDKICGDIKSFAKDKNKVYGEQLPLFTDFDYETLTGIKNCMGGCFQDKYAVYYHENTPELIYKKDITKNIPKELLLSPSIVIGGSTNLGGGYFEYQNKIYLNSTGVEVSGADLESFKFLYNDGKCGDGPHIFAKDKNNVYGEFWVLFTGFDYETLTGVYGCQLGCFQDKGYKYIWDGCDEKGCTYKKSSLF